MTALLRVYLKEATIEAGKLGEWSFCNRVRDDSDANQDGVVAEEAAESGQAPAFQDRAIRVFPGGLNVGNKRRRSQRGRQGWRPVHLEMWSYRQPGCQWRPFLFVFLWGDLKLRGFM